MSPSLRARMATAAALTLNCGCPGVSGPWYWMFPWLCVNIIRQTFDKTFDSAKKRIHASVDRRCLCVDNLPQGP
jgi:hypothetical protein